MRNNLPTDLFKTYENSKKNTRYWFKEVSIEQKLTDRELTNLVLFSFVMYIRDISFACRLSHYQIMEATNFHKAFYWKCVQFLVNGRGFIPHISYMSILRLYSVFKVPFNQNKYIDIYANYCNNDVKMALDSYKIEFI